MPHSLSAKKRTRQNTCLRTRNRTIKSRIQTARRAFIESVEARDVEAARAALRQCEKLLHRAADNGPLHRNTAGRTISRLRHRLADLERAAG